MERKTISINIIFFFLLLVLSIFQVVMLNQFSTIGEELNKISQKIERQEAENSLYSEKIASASSIAIISERSENLGLVKTSDLLSLEQAPPVAFGPDLNL